MNDILSIPQSPDFSFDSLQNDLHMGFGSVNVERLQKERWTDETRSTKVFPEPDGGIEAQTVATDQWLQEQNTNYQLELAARELGIFDSIKQLKVLNDEVRRLTTDRNDERARIVSTDIGRVHRGMRCLADEENAADGLITGEPGSAKILGFFFLSVGGKEIRSKKEHRPKRKPGNITHTGSTCGIS